MGDDGIIAVIPASKAHLQALLHGDVAFEREFDMRVAAGLVEFAGMLEGHPATSGPALRPRSLIQRATCTEAERAPP
jgi:hypothetical protein